MSDDKREPSASSEPSLEEQIAVARKIATRQGLLSFAIIATSLLLLMGSLLGIASAVKISKQLTSQNPTLRISDVVTRADKARATAEEQYAEYHKMMDDDTVRSVNQKLGVLYRVAQEGEIDYRAFLVNYKLSIFNIASRVPGSSVWHEHYARGLIGLINNSKYREQVSGVKEAVERRKQ